MGNGKQVMTIDIHGMNFSYIVNNQVLTSSSLTLRLINEDYGIGITSSTSADVHANKDIYFNAGRYLWMTSDNKMMIETPDLVMKRPNLPDAHGYTGTFAFYDYQGSLRQIDFYNGVCIDTN
jgi:hypothetical protein